MPRLSRKAGRPAHITTAAPDHGRLLCCPSCGGLLTFIHSTIGGVMPIEHWDRLECGTCRIGFEYRRRTRKLKRCA